MEAPGAETLALTQSGTHVSLTLRGAEYRGELRGDSIVAHASARPGAGRCDSLLARIGAGPAPRRMSLNLRPAARPECAGALGAVRAEDSGGAAKGGRR